MFPTTNELKEKANTETTKHVCVVTVSVHVVVNEVIPSVALNALQASVRDEQLVGTGGVIALSGNTPPHQ